MIFLAVTLTIASAQLGYGGYGSNSYGHGGYGHGGGYHEHGHYQEHGEYIPGTMLSK